MLIKVLYLCYMYEECIIKGLLTSEVQPLQFNLSEALEQYL